MSYKEDALKLHKELEGKLEIVSKRKIKDKDDLSLLYTPGVAEPCLKIAAEPDDSYVYTAKGNIVAVVSDGSAVLGLGNIGGAAGMPVMEGKAVLFKEFGAVDAVPLCLATQDTEEIIQIVKNLEPSFGGINLEDIAAPRCFEIEKRLIEEMNIPVFHDDQHGTAIVSLAGLINAFSLTNRKIEEAKVVINGAGSAGTAIADILLAYGFVNVIVCDSKGAIVEGDSRLNSAKTELSARTNPHKENGSLKDVLKNADVFLGVSAPNLLDRNDIATMKKDSIVFAMANPVPEIYPDEAKAGGAAIVATGRSDFQNQINNVLAFPGIFRGALDSRSRKITMKMKLAAAKGIAHIVTDTELAEGTVIPSAFNKGVAESVAIAVAEQAVKCGESTLDIEVIKKRIQKHLG